MSRRRKPNRQERRKKAVEQLKQLEAEKQLSERPQSIEKQVPPKTMLPWHRHLWNIPRGFWWSVGAIAAVLGIIEGVFFMGSLLRPSISIEPNSETSGANFTDTRFNLTDTSLLSVYNVKYIVYCWDGDTPAGVKLKVHIDEDVSPPITLSPGAPQSIRIGFRAFPVDLSKAAPSVIPDWNHPFYYIWVDYKTIWGGEGLIGRCFWAYKKNDHYVWMDCGLAPIPHSAEDFPRMNK